MILAIGQGTYFPRFFGVFYKVIYRQQLQGWGGGCITNSMWYESLNVHKVFTKSSEKVLILVLTGYWCPVYHIASLPKSKDQPRALHSTIVCRLPIYVSPQTCTRPILHRKYKHTVCTSGSDFIHCVCMSKIHSTIFTAPTLMVFLYCAFYMI